MDVVNLEAPVTSDKTGVHVPVEIVNYTPRARVLELFLEIPAEMLAVAAFDPAPDGTEKELGRAWWTLPKLAPSGRTQLALTFPPKTDLEVSDLDWDIAGIDESHLLGADPLPGDWDVRSPRTIVEAAEAAAAEVSPTGAGEEEVDYDAAESSASASEDE